MSRGDLANNQYSKTDPRVVTINQVGVFNGGGRIIVQAAADGLGVRPASQHVGRAQPHEFAARIKNIGIDAVSASPDVRATAPVCTMRPWRSTVTSSAPTALRGACAALIGFVS